MRIASIALAITLALTGATIIPGCDNKPKNEPLIAAPTSPVADVPVPSGFAMVTAESTSKVIPASATRFVDHQYKGNDDFMPVVKFYQVQMPKFKWTFADQTQGINGKVTLHFTKNSEDCFITVEDGTAFKSTRIRVKIDPIARNTR